MGGLRRSEGPFGHFGHKAGPPLHVRRSGAGVSRITRRGSYDPLAGWYGRSVRVIEEVREAFASDRLGLVLRPVVARDGALFYCECRLAVVDARGATLRSDEFLPALEQFDAIGWFDRYALGRVLDELENAPRAVLGCNISGQSLCDPAWIDRVVDELAARPRLTRQLLVQITETAASIDLDAAAEHVSLLRKLGVLVVFDDFGAGVASVGQLVDLKPDIVKFGARLVAASLDGSRELDRLADLVATMRRSDLQIAAKTGGDKAGIEALARIGVSYFQEAPWRSASQEAACLFGGAGHAN